MATNPDGTVTLKTTGKVASTPRAASSIARSAVGSRGGLSGASGSNGRLQKTKGTSTTGRSAYR